MWSLACLKRMFLLTVFALTVVFLAMYGLLYYRGSFDLFRDSHSENRPPTPFMYPELEILKTFSNASVLTDKDLKGVKCVHPPLDLYDTAIMQHYRKEPPIDCSSAMQEWVYVVNGTFRISRDAIRQYGDITCAYRPILWETDYSAKHGPTVKPMKDGSPLKSDFFHVVCESGDKKTTYTNVHAAVAWNTAVMNRLRKYHSSAKSSHSSNQPKDSSNNRTIPEDAFSNLSIFMLGFDSMSSMSWRRNLPKSHKYFTETMGAIELQNHNIMGDASAAALLPMFCGQKKEELPEARPGVKGAKQVDGYPFIWKNFSQQGYVTAFAQDRPIIGAFQINMKGFERQPTDHYLRTFYLGTQKLNLKNPSRCWGTKPRHMNFMDWFGSLLDMYKEFPKLFIGHYLEMSHDHMWRIEVMDDDLLAFLQELERKGHLNSTLLVLFADHGARFSHIRQTVQGTLEERLPYFAFRFPPWFHNRYPSIIKNMRTNAKRLTTPLDIHATLQDVLRYSPVKNENRRTRGMSLFKEIPKERSCTQAGITPHWCACLEWKPVNSSTLLVVQAVATAIRKINNLTESQRSVCAVHALQHITKSVVYVPSSDDLAAEFKWMKFQKMDAKPPSLTHRYRVAFSTLPGQAQYEVTSEFDPESKKFTVDEKQISRINKYGHQADCVLKTKPHLRPYCYCMK